MPRRPKLTKDEEFFSTLEEVFDGATVLAAYKLIRRGVIDHFHGAVAAGKESRLYWAVAPDGSDLAVKIYLTSSAEFRRSIRLYLEDEAVRMARGDFRKLIFWWCRREFMHLRRAYKAGVRVPKPIAFYENILVMEFIGRGGRPAPLIKDMPPEDPEEAYKTVLRYIDLLYNRAGIVHSDLSEYNILNFDEDLVIIDLGQSVENTHPMALDYLRRDIENITRYFGGLGARTLDPKTVYRRIVGSSGTSYSDRRFFM